KYLSVTHPAANIPIIPNISNTATVHPAFVKVMPCASFKQVGPQSNTAKRTTYTKKLAIPKIHIHLLRYTAFRTKALNSADASLPFLWVLCGSCKSTGGGGSRRSKNKPIVPANAIAGENQQQHARAPYSQADSMNFFMRSLSARSTFKLP